MRQTPPSPNLVPKLDYCGGNVRVRKMGLPLWQHVLYAIVVFFPIALFILYCLAVWA